MHADPLVASRSCQRQDCLRTGKHHTEPGGIIAADYLRRESKPLAPPSRLPRRRPFRTAPTAESLWRRWRPFAFVIGTYAVVALQQITLPGVYMDAVNPDYIAVRLLHPEAEPLLPWLLPGNLLLDRAPILISFYHGSQQVWLGLPFFAIFGTGVAGLRLTHAMFALGVLAALYAGSDAAARGPGTQRSRAQPSRSTPRSRTRFEHKATSRSRPPHGSSSRCTHSLAPMMPAVASRGGSSQAGSFTAWRWSATSSMRSSCPRS